LNTVPVTAQDCSDKDCSPADKRRFDNNCNFIEEDYGDCLGYSNTRDALCARPSFGRKKKKKEREKKECGKS